MEFIFEYFFSSSLIMQNIYIILYLPLNCMEHSVKLEQILPSLSLWGKISTNKLSKAYIVLNHQNSFILNIDVINLTALAIKAAEFVLSIK